MNFRVSDMIQSKMSEIKSRIPVNLNLFNETTQTKPAVSFKDVLSEQINNATVASDPTLDKSYSYGSDIDTSSYAPLTASTATISTSKAATLSIIDENILKASKKYGVDPSLIKAVIKQESGFDPKSLSGAGAQGLMQLMPGTARALNVSNPYDIAQSIDGGTQYLSDQLKEFKGDTNLALAAYNAGPGAVKKYGGIPPYHETQDYVKKVSKFYQEYTAKGT